MQLVGEMDEQEAALQVAAKDMVQVVEKAPKMVEMQALPMAEQKGNGWVGYEVDYQVADWVAKLVVLRDVYQAVMLEMLVVALKVVMMEIQLAEAMALKLVAHWVVQLGCSKGQMEYCLVVEMVQRQVEWMVDEWVASKDRLMELFVAVWMVL